jgi:hypothetical protein
MFNYKERKEIHYKRICLEALTVKLVDPYLPLSWQLLLANSAPCQLSPESIPLLLTHLTDPSVCIDIDHDEKGRRKYLRMSDVLENVRNKKALKYQRKFDLGYWRNRRLGIVEQKW